MECGVAQALSMASTTAGVTLRSAATRSLDGSYGIGAESTDTHRALRCCVLHSEEEDSEYDLISSPHSNIILL